MVKKRKRKMTAEQKAAAAERLAKARAARNAANPPEYKSIHPKVLARGEDHALSMKNVREWIKYQRELLSAEKKNARNGTKNSEAKIVSIQGYISNMEAYLRHGDWIDMFYGERGTNPTQSRCIAMAYDSKGYAKRTVGVWYPDINEVWTQEMDKQERASRG